MQIVYCEACSKRIPAADLENKSATFIDENQALCAACSAARVAVEVPAAPPASPEVAPARQPTGTHVRPSTARMEPRPTTRRTTTLVKKGAASSGGMSSVKERSTAPAESKKPPIAAIAGGGAAALCVILYLLFGRSSTATQTAAANSSENKPSDAKPADTPAKVEALKPQMAAADATPANPVETSAQKDAEARPVEKAKSAEPAAPTALRRAVEEKAAAPAPAEHPEADAKVAPAPQPEPDAKAKAPDVELLLGTKEKEKVQPAPPEAAAAAKDGVPAAPAKANPLNDDTPDDPVKRDGADTRKAAPPNKAGDAAGNPAAPPPAAANAPKPAASKPAFTRGKQCDLFPAGATSHTDDVVDPRNNKPAKIDRFDGWIFNSQQLTGMSVKGGILSLDHQALMQLDRFPDLEYKLQFEVQLGGNSALALQTGAAIAVSNLLIITDTHAMPGEWDTAKAANNIKGEDKLAKPHGGAKEGWIPVMVAVHADAVDCVFGNGKPIRFALPKTATLAQLGFLTLGIKGNTNPSVKIRKASLYAP